MGILPLAPSVTGAFNAVQTAPVVWPTDQVTDIDSVEKVDALAPWYTQTHLLRIARSRNSVGAIQALPLDQLEPIEVSALLKVATARELVSIARHSTDMSVLSRVARRTASWHLKQLDECNLGVVEGQAKDLCWTHGSIVRALMENAIFPYHSKRRLIDGESYVHRSELLWSETDLPKKFIEQVSLDVIKTLSTADAQTYILECGSVRECLYSRSEDDEKPSTARLLALNLAWAMQLLQRESGNQTFADDLISEVPDEVAVSVVSMTRNVNAVLASKSDMSCGLVRALIDHTYIDREALDELNARRVEACSLSGDLASRKAWFDTVSQDMLILDPSDLDSRPYVESSSGTGRVTGEVHKKALDSIEYNGLVERIQTFVWPDWGPSDTLESHPKIHDYRLMLEAWELTGTSRLSVKPLYPLPEYALQDDGKHLEIRHFRTPGCEP